MMGEFLMFTFDFSMWRSMISTTKSSSDNVFLRIEVDYLTLITRRLCISFFITPSRTVAICGRQSGLTIVATMLPPKAGRI